MNYRLSELVDIPKVQALCENFTQLTGFVTAILDMDGSVLVNTGWQQICTRFHRSNAQFSRGSNISTGSYPSSRHRNTALA
ncbi:MAG: hypothetical protein EG825_06715 [Rhodocyclaceae bacterium]|nr:hypothetical protein [Rhodocyclaceae bacterium]